MLMLFASEGMKTGWRQLLLWYGLVGLSCFGCAPAGPVRQAVSGQVTLDDKPVSSVRIVFVPTGSGQVGAAVDVEDGSFIIPTDKGPAAGPFCVIVERIEPDLEEYEAMRQAGKMPFSQIRVHPRYGKSGALTANVEAERANQYLFELKSR